MLSYYIIFCLLISILSGFTRNGLQLYRIRCPYRYIRCIVGYHPRTKLLEIESLPPRLSFAAHIALSRTSKKTRERPAMVLGSKSVLQTNVY